MEWLSETGGRVGSIVPFLDSLPLIRAVLGFILVFFLPGFAWTLVFFRGKQINAVERLVLSIALSLAMVTLSILALNKLVGMRITGANAILTILVITVIPVIVYFVRKLIAKKASPNNKISQAN